MLKNEGVGFNCRAMQAASESNTRKSGGDTKTDTLHWSVFLSVQLQTQRELFTSFPRQEQVVVSFV